MTTIRAPAAFQDFERRFNVIHSERAVAPTGEPHVTLCGDGDGCMADAEDAAVFAAQEYAANRTGTLYWRTVPEFRHGGGVGSWSFFMRLLISDKEPKT
jgi:hypothetical protein